MWKKPMTMIEVLKEVFSHVSNALEVGKGQEYIGTGDREAGVQDGC